MGNIKKSDAMQVLGFFKICMIITLCTLFIYAEFYFIEKTDLHGVLIGIIMLPIGIFLIALGIAGKKLFDWFEKCIENRESTIKQEEPLNISEEPKRKIKIPKIHIPKITKKEKKPKSEFKDYSLQKTEVGSLPIEESIPEEKLPIEE